MASDGDLETGPEGFLEATSLQARVVLDAEEGWPTYWAGMRFGSLATEAMSAPTEHGYLPELPTAIFLIWAALTDEMDAPGRGSAEQNDAAVRHMRRAASEWIEVVDSPDGRAAYCDRWIHEECGYQREPAPGARRILGRVPGLRKWLKAKGRVRP